MKRSSPPAIGIALTAIAVFALVGIVDVSLARDGDHRSSRARKVQQCVQELRQDLREADRDERKEIFKEFRKCMNDIKKPGYGNHSSKSSRSSMSGSSVSSRMQRNVRVEIDDMDYEPSTLTVKRGTKVKWVNEDDVAHTVTSNVIGGPNSGQLDEDESYSFTFTQTGTYVYHCAFHPSMTGSVIVTE